MEEFGIVDETCYFCGHEKTLRFKEHYTFCPYCSAIYTSMIAIKTCRHFKDDVVVVNHEPWFENVKKELLEKNKAYIMEASDDPGCGSCSICSSYCTADGW
jgi:hypothetical protein